MTGTESSLTAASVSLTSPSGALCSLPARCCAHSSCNPYGLLLPQSVNTHTVETDTATRVLRSVMERTSDTRRVIHISLGERSPHS